MAGTEEGPAAADVRIDSTKSVVIVAAGFIKGRLNNYGPLGRRDERQQSRRRLLSVLVTLTERGKHRAAEGARPSVGRYRQVNIVKEYEKAAIRHHGRMSGVPIDAVGNRKNPASYAHHVEDRQSEP